MTGYIDGIDGNRLLEHAEEIQLATRVQRLRRIESVMPDVQSGKSLEPAGSDRPLWSSSQLQELCYKLAQQCDGVSTDAPAPSQRLPALDSVPDPGGQYEERRGEEHRSTASGYERSGREAPASVLPGGMREAAQEAGVATLPRSPSRTGQTRTGQTRTGQTRTGQTRTGQTPGQVDAATLDDTLDEAPPAATAALIGWAAAANVSVHQLCVSVREGRDAERRIVASNVGLVGSAIKHLKRRSGGMIDKGTSEQDLMQEGCVSLIKAAERFDVSLGLRFSTYANFWIQAALKKVLDEQSRTIRLPTRLQTTYRKIKRATDELTARTNRVPSEEEISEHLDYALSAQKVRQVMSHVRTRTTSLDSSLSHKDESLTLADYIEDKRETVQANVVQSMLRKDLDTLMKRYLKPQEIRVLELRFGIHDGEGRTVRRVSEELGLPYRSVQHLLWTGLSKMRKPHVASALREYTAEDW